MREKTRGYIQLMRPYAAYLVPSMVILGAICNNEFDPFRLLLLFIIGIFIHIVLMVQNDYFDIEIDKQSKYVSKRPLVTGVISAENALVLWIFFFLLSIGLTIIFFPTILSLASLLFILLLTTLYNRYSKNIPGMEYVLGAAAFACGMFGALTVSDAVAPLVIVISFLALIKYVFNVGISANIKDLKYDRQFGLKTTPMLFGVKMDENDFYIPKKFILYAFCIKLAYISIALIPFMLGDVSFFVYGIPIPGILFALCSIGILYTIYMILSTSVSQRDKMISYAGAHELLSYFLMPILLMAFLIENLNMFVFLLFIFGPPIWTVFSLKVFFEKEKPNE